MGVNFNDNSERVKMALDGAVRRALETIAIAGAAHADDEMNKPFPHADGTSRPYIDTGRLVGSINSMVQGKTAYIGTNVEYAIWIHEGTKRIKHPNRFLKNAVVNNVDEYKSIIEDELKNTTL